MLSARNSHQICIDKIMKQYIQCKHQSRQILRIYINTKQNRLKPKNYQQKRGVLPKDNPVNVHRRPYNSK